MTKHKNAGRTLKRFYERLGKEVSDLEYMYSSSHPTTRYSALQRLEKLQNILSTRTTQRTLLLDVGCGDGVLVNHISRAAKTIGVDLASERIKRAASRMPQNSFIVADAASLPIDAERVDLAVCSEVLEHLPLPGRCISEIWRVLRLGEQLVLTTPNSLSLYPRRFRHQIDEKLRRIARSLFRSDSLRRGSSFCVEERGFGHLRTFTPNDLARVLEQHGFEIDRIEFHGFIPPVAFAVLYLGFRHPLILRMWRALDDLISRIPILRTLNYRQYVTAKKASRRSTDVSSIQSFNPQ